ncbi:DUF998 domain-containing protein [Treponema sp. R80B11-R83G3]
MKKHSVIRIISLFGIFSVVFYFLHVILGNIFYEGYNPMAQAVSDLTASNSPSRNIARAFAFIYGMFSVIFTICLFTYLKNKINKIVNVASCVFCIMNIVSFFGYTFFPLSESGYAGTFQDIIHIVVTVFVVLFTVVSLMLFGIGFMRKTNYKYLGIISFITLFLLMAGSMLVGILPKEYFGFAERINVYSIVIYIGIMSLWMYNNIKKEGVLK